MFTVNASVVKLLKCTLNHPLPPLPLPSASPPQISLIHERKQLFFLFNFWPTLVSKCQLTKLLHQKHWLFRPEPLTDVPHQNVRWQWQTSKPHLRVLSTFGQWQVLISHPGQITSCPAEKVTWCEGCERPDVAHWSTTNIIHLWTSSVCYASWLWDTLEV